jgi:hypothetical protein
LKRLEHAADIRKTRVSELSKEILEIKKIKAKKEKIVEAQNNNLENFRYVTIPKCIVDQNNRTLVHLGELDDNNAVNIATEAVNSYYFHMIKEESHRSKNFWENLAEYFGVFIANSELPYTSSSTASSHNINHQKCVDNLLYALQPISNSVNKFVNKYYEHYYTKLSKLTWGPFAPRAFGIFPTIAINFNAASNYHWDGNDEPNGLCFLVALGDFEGGELCFPQLEIVVKLKPGQVVAFPSYLLLHGNLTITKGIRFSIVYFVHQRFFQYPTNYENLKNMAENDKINQPLAQENTINQPRAQEDFYNFQKKNSRSSFDNTRSWQTKEPNDEENKKDNRRYKDGKYFYKYVYFLNKKSNL